MLYVIGHKDLFTRPLLLGGGSVEIFKGLLSFSIIYAAERRGAGLLYHN